MVVWKGNPAKALRGHTYKVMVKEENPAVWRHRMPVISLLRSSVYRLWHFL
jgi:hypothetical protein